MPSSIAQLQKKVWAGSLPLEIRLAASDCRTFDLADPYLVHVPRLSYLPFLLPRLQRFFASSLIDPSVEAHDAWFSFENVPLKWHYPVGLLYDLFSGAQPATPEDAGTASSSIIGTQAFQAITEDSQGAEIPWKITVHYTEFPDEQLVRLDKEGKVLLDAYINSVKEADFIRNGTARVVMSLSRDDSTSLWRSVESHNLTLFNSVNNKLLNPPGSALRHIPMKVYLPTAPPQISDSSPGVAQQGSIRVVQGLVTVQTSSRQSQTLGMALNALLPTVFPSRRNPVLACPVLHGAVVPMSAGVGDLCRAASYTDGFLHIAVTMLG